MNGWWLGTLIAVSSVQIGIMRSAIVLIALLAIPSCQGAEGFGQKKKKVPEIMRDDLPHIGCSVCKGAVEEMHTIISDRREKAPYKKLDENQIVEVIDTICDPDGPEGGWIRAVDVVEEKQNGRRFLEFETPGGMGKCKKECRTIAKSCYDLLEEDIDRDELSPLLWKNTIKNAQELQEKVCKKMSKRCSDKRVTTNKPLAGSSKRVDEYFEPVSDKDLEMEKMLKEMEKSGMGGSIYNRDDMEGMQGMMSGMGDGSMDEDEMMEKMEEMGMAGGMGGMGGMPPPPDDEDDEDRPNPNGGDMEF